MYYHLYLEFNNKNHKLWNLDIDSIVQEYIVPILNNQFILLRRAEGEEYITAFSSFIVYKTDGPLSLQSGEIAPSVLGTPGFKTFACTGDILQEARRRKVSDIWMQSIMRRASGQPRNAVFVIMKLQDPELDSAYNRVVKPIFESFGVAVERADNLQDSGPISYAILELIASSRFVYADLTGARPNCYYETGFAQALGKSIILAVREPKDVHFDLGHYRFLTWSTESDLQNRLIARLTALSRDRKN